MLHGSQAGSVEAVAAIPVGRELRHLDRANDRFLGRQDRARRAFATLPPPSAQPDSDHPCGTVGLDGGTGPPLWTDRPAQGLARADWRTRYLPRATAGGGGPRSSGGWGRPRGGGARQDRGGKGPVVAPAAASFQAEVQARSVHPA